MNKLKSKKGYRNPDPVSGVVVSAVEHNLRRLAWRWEHYNELAVAVRRRHRALYGAIALAALASILFVIGMLLSPWLAYAAVGGSILLAALVIYDSAHDNLSEWRARADGVSGAGYAVRYHPAYKINMNIVTIGAALATALLCGVSFMYPLTTYVAIPAGALMICSVLVGSRTHHHDDYVSLVGTAHAYDRLQWRVESLWTDIRFGNIDNADAGKLLAEILVDVAYVERRVPPNFDHRLN